MNKKLLVVILCGLMIFCFVACGKDATSEILSDDTSSITEETNTNSEDETHSEPAFVTENIANITFYAYYGEGKGSEVPSENMEEVTRWLGTFVIDKAAEDMLPPGTNTVYVEIEYLDGTIVKEGLDVVSMDGVSYYLKHAPKPDCFTEIISKARLE